MSARPTPLANLLASPPKSSRGPACTTCAWLAKADSDEARALRDALANPAWEFTKLAETMRANGHDLSEQSLSRHAKGRCAAREVLRPAA